MYCIINSKLKCASVASSDGDGGAQVGVTLFLLLPLLLQRFVAVNLMKHVKNKFTPKSKPSQLIYILHCDTNVFFVLIKKSIFTVLHERITVIIIHTHTYIYKKYLYVMEF